MGGSGKDVRASKSKASKAKGSSHSKASRASSRSASAGSESASGTSAGAATGSKKCCACTEGSNSSVSDTIDGRISKKFPRSTIAISGTTSSAHVRTHIVCGLFEEDRVNGSYR